MYKIEAIERLGVKIRIVMVGNDYRYDLYVGGVRHKGKSPSRDGAIAMAYDRIKRDKRTSA